MANHIDLILYPFPAKNKEDLILFRLDDGYEMRFTHDVFSKRVASNRSVHLRNYIEIEIGESEARILNEYKELHEFNAPCDFYIPQEDSARNFYKDLYSTLVHKDLEAVVSMASNVEDMAKREGFPAFNAVLATTTSHFENYSRVSAKNDSPQIIPAVQIRIEEDIPVSCEKNVFESAKLDTREDIFEVQDLFYRYAFGKSPILRFKTVVELYEEYPFKNGIVLASLKKYIALHAYFFISGPWRKCWVRFGYDPKLDCENYKHQVIEMRSKRANFQIFQKPEIEHEVSKNREWYVLKEFDKMDGFISKPLKNFIIYSIDEQGAIDIDNKIEDIHDSDVELFD